MMLHKIGDTLLILTLRRNSYKIVTDLSYRVDPEKIILIKLNFPPSEKQKTPWFKTVTDSGLENKQLLSTEMS